MATPNRIEIKRVTDVLREKGLRPVPLTALTTEFGRYRALLLQPRADIEIGKDWLRNRDRNDATAQHRAFLELAHKEGADLVVTPEYSCPWEVVADVVARLPPAAGQLWALGCESITLADLGTWSAQIGAKAEVIYDSPPPDRAEQLDPLVFVFRAAHGDDSSRVVVLVQFKTCPMGGSQYEIDGLRTGNVIYEFGGDGLTRLFGLICSDVLHADLESLVNRMHQQSLILHIQLNEAPGHVQYRRYRQLLFGRSGDDREIVCLNWARKGKLQSNGKSVELDVTAASGWYMSSSQLLCGDADIHKNHERGMYYTWLPERHCGLFFNFEPHAFLVSASRVRYTTEGIHGHRGGPKMEYVYDWDGRELVPSPLPLDDGFGAVVSTLGRDLGELPDLARHKPLEAERLAWLTTGGDGTGILNREWHLPRVFDPCKVELTDNQEVIRRLTFTHSAHPATASARERRLAMYARLLYLLRSRGAKLPALSGFGSDPKPRWSASEPSSNLRSENGIHATAIFLSEVSDHTARNVCDMIRRSLEVQHAELPDAERRKIDPKRVVVWYHTSTDYDFKSPSTTFSEDPNESATSILREP